MCALLMLWMALIMQVAPKPGSDSAGLERKSPETSSYFAFVDREYIFTVEIVKPGLPILNFISMSENESTLVAGQIRLAIENRPVPGKLFIIDTGDPKAPIMTPTIRIHARSSFGVTINGEFNEAKECSGVTLWMGLEAFTLAPLTGFDFENLALKVSRINLASPDFSDDWRALKLDSLGTRAPAARERRER
jgi:hypothetical protein